MLLAACTTDNDTRFQAGGFSGGEVGGNADDHGRDGSGPQVVGDIPIYNEGVGGKDASDANRQVR